MSRILVKNLPPSLTSKDFKTHFSQTSSAENTLDVTDVKLVHKKDGTFRRFGFIGYKTPAEAQTALNWFNGTYFGSARIQVELIEDGLKSERPVKRARHEGLSQEKPSKKDDKTTNDPLFKEYLNVMQKSKTKLPRWADLVMMEDGPPKSTEPEPPSKEENPEIADEETKDGPVSDMDWLKSKMAAAKGGEDKVFFQEDEKKSSAPKDKEPELVEVEEPEADKATQTILSTARLFLRNLTFSVSIEELEQQFSQFGPIDQVHIPTTSDHKGKGMAYVKFKHGPHALEAFQKLDGTVFQGRLLHVLPALDRQTRSDAEKSQAVKNKKLDAKKQVAVKKNHLWDWGALYMNSDAVASSIASRFGLTKADILQEGDDHASATINPAVKLALAETHIIEETRKFLANQGVHLGAFSSESNGARHAKSPTTLLIKNIPFGTSDNILRDMFAEHGEIVRLIIPPSGTIAVIDFDDSSSADSAVRYLSYKRVGNSVMYIERAPEAVWQADDEDNKIAGNSSSGPKPITISETHTEVNTAAGSTLYVKNLSFNTASESLVRAFQHLPDFSFARVSTKPDPKNSGGKLSMGFGFVGFSTVDGAKRAQSSMDGYVLDGHKLVVKFAGRGTEDAGESKAGAVGKRQTTKMLVKNLPFEATKKDVRQLFGAHGQLKSVRVPKRFDSRSRGFAFLDFVSRQEAERVYGTLKHTHLLGRHLVLEWAEDDSEDIEKLREKVGVGYGEGKALPGKKRKVMMDTGADSDES